MEVKKRFRFSEEERLAALKELYEAIYDNVSSSEEELWKKVHNNLCCENRIRYSTCTVRGLREHMLLQVTKYKKCDSEEATEAEKEKMKTSWGNMMRNLMDVWTNYEELVKTEIELKIKAKKRKVDDNHRSMEFENKTDDSTIIATAIAQSAFVFDNDLADCGFQPCAAFLAEVSQNDSAHSADECDDSTKTEYIRTSTSGTKNRKINRNNVFSYLMEKCQMEMEDRDKDRQLRYEELALQKARLKFEEKKWAASLEDNKANAQLSQATSALLTTILRSGILNKIDKK